MHFVSNFEMHFILHSKISSVNGNKIAYYKWDSELYHLMVYTFGYLDYILQDTELQFQESLDLRTWSCHLKFKTLLLINQRFVWNLELLIYHPFLLFSWIPLLTKSKMHLPSILCFIFGHHLQVDTQRWECNWIS